jgi:histone-lysine N-methyltransferase SETMAR
MKKMLITFFDIKGTVHFDFIPQCRTVNQTYEYLSGYVKLCVEKSLNYGPNAPANKVLSVKHFLTEKSNNEMEHPPYYPDLAPNDFWLFRKIKSALKGRNFQDMKTSKM